jgi:RNA polymerase sigma-70 factor (ECF subfamily)
MGWTSTEAGDIFRRIPAQEVNRSNIMHPSIGKNKLTADEMMPLVYEDLRRVAHRYLLGEMPGHTLRPTALVNEAYLKLAAQRKELHDKSKFLGVACRAMRNILVDHARARGRQKRGLRPKMVTLNEMVAIGEVDWPVLLDLDQALEKLEQHDKRKSQVIELLFFGGLTYDECAAALAISTVTLFRELRMAKAWLYRELGPGPVRP